MRKLFAIVALFAAFCVACNNEPTPTPSNVGKVTIESEQFIDFDTYGGNGEIIFSYDGESLDDVKVKCDAAWVENLAIGETITFSVGYNNTSDIRSAWVVVSAGSQSETVVVTQQKGGAIDVELQAAYLNGTYYGRDGGTAGYNYYAIISDVPTPYASAAPSNGVQYRLDLYSDVFGGFGKAAVPEGVYKYDGGDNYEPGSFADKYSSYVTTLYDFQEIRIVQGCVYVRENSIEAYLKLQNNEIHHIVYTGSLELGYPGVDVPPFSLLQEDFSFDYDLATSDIRAMYFGDRYGIGNDNWTLEMIEVKSTYSGDYFILNLLLPLGEADPKSVVGEYKLWSKDLESYDYTFIPGTLVEGAPKYSWYMTCTSGAIDGQNGGPLMDGTIVVKQMGAEYQVIFDCIDDKGNKIQGSFKSPMNEFYDRT